MKPYKHASIAALLLLFVFLPSLSFSQYWFQSGVRGSNGAGFNNGASATIQTVYQNVSGGSFGFWVGEDLSNGAFVQMGYEISNVSGDFPKECSPSGCSNYTYVEAGVPTWFWEYFPSGYSGSSFYGGIGGNASAGLNGTFNNYSFSSSGNTWNFYFNGNFVGSADLGTSSSGPNPPTAFAEYADAESNNQYMYPVLFKNMAFLQNGVFKLVPKGYSYVGYGKGSDTVLPNLYGVKEIGSYSDYFQVGSGLPIPQNYTMLWSIGYFLTIKSQYANISSKANYLAYSSANISAPSIVYLSNNKREIFAGWKGDGTGSYTGHSANATVQMDSNITETATWQTQYYVNVTSEYGQINGSGWYASGSEATLSVPRTIIATGSGSREYFKGWSNGESSSSISFVVSGPMNLSAEWVQQYLVNASSPYGKVLGTGWYNANSTANIQVSETNISTGAGSRISFEEWSNGNTSSSIHLKVASPEFLSAIFVPQYYVILHAENAYGDPINPDYLNIGGRNVTNATYLDANTTYSISYAFYKGVPIQSNYRFSVPSPESISFKLPIYNVVFHSASIFGTPINASVIVKFKNGTSSTFYLGSNGTKVLYNVPYGYADAYFTYFGITQSALTQYGSPISIIMFTPSLIYAIIAGIAIILAVAKISSAMSKKHAAKQRGARG
ncbi:MAG: hypothetical protein ACP5SJ_01825 [Candidatus Micrarchaeia archaeon]